MVINRRIMTIDLAEQLLHMGRRLGLPLEFTLVFVEFPFLLRVILHYHYLVSFLDTSV